jgi:hypothetical protein
LRLEYFLERGCRFQRSSIDKGKEAIIGVAEPAARRLVMRFLSIFKTAETGVPPTPQHMETMQRLIEDGMKAGWLLATEGCLPSALGARVRSSGGNVTVTDGPFAETKEIIGGFALLEAASKEEAVRLTKEFLKVAGDGECELRQIFTPSDVSGDCSGAHQQLAEQFARQ